MSDESTNVKDYGWATETGPQSCGYIAPRIVEIVQQAGHRRIADLGSGNGALCAALASLPDREVVGIEYDTNGVAIAKSNYPKIHFYQQGVQDDPMLVLNAEQGRKFDCVVSTEVIEHLYAPHLLPRYARALLVDGGEIVLTTPYHGYLKNLALAVTGSWDKHHTALWHGGHIKFWSRPTITKLLEDEGFTVTSFGGVGRLPLLWKSMVVVAKKNQAS